MTVSGIFRDLFAPTLGLLDKAVRTVAELDEPFEMNYVRRNIQEKLAADGTSFDDAVTRVFSNAPGNYGTNVNFMVMQSAWEDEAALGDLFVTRKCFAYTRDSEGRTIEGREAPQLMNEALSQVEATYQNIDSFEVGPGQVLPLELCHCRSPVAYCATVSWPPTCTGTRSSGSSIIAASR